MGDAIGIRIESLLPWPPSTYRLPMQRRRPTTGSRCHERERVVGLAGKPKREEAAIVLAQGWEIAGYASGYDNRTSLILFRHPGVNVGAGGHPDIEASLPKFLDLRTEGVPLTVVM
jgi:hypothetical protein